MNLRSFRIRIALLSAVLAGGALVGFGLISWWLIYEAKVSRLDAELESQLMRASRPRSAERWQAYEALLPRAFGANAKTPIGLLILDATGNVAYRSDQWPTDLDISHLWLTRPLQILLPHGDNHGDDHSDSRTNRLTDRPSQPLPLPLADPSSAPDPSAPDPSAPERSQGNPDAPDRGEPRPPDVAPPAPRYVTQRTGSGTWRIGAVTTPFTQMAIAVSLNAVDQEMAVIRNIFVISIPGVLLLVAGGAWAVAGSSLRPVRRLTGVIATVTASGLEQRVPIGTTDIEFVELIQVFNQMLERLERSFKQSSRFSADAAHELKTPLAILQGELERTLQQAEPGSEVQQSLSNLLDEVRRLSGIVRKLLLLSLADAGQMAIQRSEVDLSRLLRELLEDIELLAPELEVQSAIADHLWVKGDRDLLVQVLQNLISNAIKYNLPNGWIRVAGQRQGAAVAITVSNSSKGIPQSDRSRIFDRFHRGDPARTRKVEGIGLGLSLAREIVRAHQGNLTLDPDLPGQTSFTLMLPAIGLSADPQ